ncbi:hypothetical protein [Nonomuraea sp. NPDC023979]|uniref:hypothetical protein n=1 Tax=Nonomuraea sp. NPDC023979 TaxID=3154796 RepID=UPI0033DDA9AF
MSSDEPTLGEVARTLNRFVEDTQRRFSDLNTTIGIFVTRDLYEAHRAAMQEDIKELQAEMKAEQDRRADEKKTEQDRRSADRRMAHSALIGAALSLIVTVVAAALVLALGLK